jgi:thiamine biosynthesis lipoprotein
VHEACLQSGGSTALALEPPPNAAGWPIGLGDHTINLRRAALSGSGLAVKGDHLIDPQTGIAAARRQRVWAFARSGAAADALSTAFFVMSDAAVAEYCHHANEVGAVLAQADGTLIGYGALPVDLSSAIRTTPGRKPT